MAGLGPQKDEIHRSRSILGGNLFKYLGEVLLEIIYIKSIKMFWNGVISILNDRYIAFSIKPLYLTTPLTKYKYIEVTITKIKKK